jgi:hypothetical protein
MPEDVFTLFYAWQSDTPSTVNRNFIEDAAQKALKRVAKSGILEASPRLDKDTQDVPGIPDIANTILDKIQNASVFLADVTYSGKSCSTEHEEPKVPKLLPNPNVMLEFGYALATLGANRIIHVLNTHYGDSRDLPFDLQNRRWPIPYRLTPDASQEERKEEKARLSDSLYKAISKIAQLPARQKKGGLEQRIQALETLVAAMSGNVAQFSLIQDSISRLGDLLTTPRDDKKDSTDNIADLREALIKRVEDSDFEGLEYESGASAQGVLVLTIMPESEPEAPLSLHEVQDIQVKLRPMSGSGWNHHRYGDRFVTYRQSGDNVIRAVSEIGDKGTISAASHIGGRYGNESDDSHYVPSIGFKRSLLKLYTDTSHC